MLMHTLLAVVFLGNAGQNAEKSLPKRCLGCRHSFGQKPRRMTDTEERQASLHLKFRGLPPLLHTIQFSCPPVADKVTDLQNRDLPRAVAVALLLFRMNGVGTLFRIRTRQPAGTFVHTILNAK